MPPSRSAPERVPRRSGPRVPRGGRARLAARGAILIAASVALGPGARACDATQVAATTTPTPPPTEVQEQVFAEALTRVRTPHEAILVGDSLVQFWPPELARRAFPGARVLNFGVGLDRTQHVLWRLQSDGLRALRIREVVLLLGTNNLRAGDSACATLAGLDAVAERIHNLWPKARATIVEVPPRGVGFAYRQDDRAAVNAGLEAVAARFPGWSTINLDRALTCGFVQPCENYLSDTIHFTERGYGVLSDALRRGEGGRQR